MHSIHTERMILPDSFTVAAMVEKLPTSWKDAESYLKHKQNEMTLEDLIIKLQIEEDNLKENPKPRTMDA